MPHRNWVQIVTVLVACLLEVEALRCMSCLGIFEPRYCVQTKECTAGEICYTEQVIDDDLNVFYNTGCKSEDLCKVAISDGFGKRSGQLHVCEKCCKAEKCNVDACVHTNATGGNLCLQCSDVARPLDCTAMVECRVDEMCFTQEFVNAQLQKRFRLGCEKIKKCELLEQLLPHTRSTQLCNMCCKNQGCNKHLCEDTSVGSAPGTTPPSIAVTPDFNFGQRSSSKATSAPITTHRPATTQPTTRQPTTSQIRPCQDSTIVNCLDLNATGTLCLPGSPAAAKYCPKFCKLC